jgi:tight adherence protein B
VVALAASVAAIVIGPLAAASATAVVVLGTRLREWRRRAAVSAHVEAAMPSICDHLARLLTAGATPIDALRGVAETAPAPLARALCQAAAAGDLGGSPADALARAAPAFRGLLPLAASWAATSAAGAPLAPALRGLGAAMLADREHKRAVDTELAGPRLTGWLLGALPIFGFGVAASLGARSVSILFGTPLGLACLAGAAALDAAGVSWLRALARRTA